MRRSTTRSARGLDAYPITPATLTRPIGVSAEDAHKYGAPAGAHTRAEWLQPRKGRRPIRLHPTPAQARPAGMTERCAALGEHIDAGPCDALRPVHALLPAWAGAQAGAVTGYSRTRWPRRSPARRIPVDAAVAPSRYADGEPDDRSAYPLLDDLVIEAVADGLSADRCSNCHNRVASACPVRRLYSSLTYRSCSSRSRRYWSTRTPRRVAVASSFGPTSWSTAGRRH